MFKLSLREIRFHPSRYLATVIAVGLSVGFLVLVSVYTATEGAAQGMEGIAVDATKWLLWTFAGIAALTGIMVISNTFTILLTQRQRQLGLLRAIGATTGQVLLATGIEALLIGLIGDLLGLVLGISLGAAFAGFTGALANGLVIGWSEIYLELFLGLLLTLIAAIAPCLRAAHVAPMAALQVVPTATARKFGVIARSIVAGLFALVGIVMVLPVFSFNQNALLFAVAASFCFAVTLLVAAPLYLKPILWLLAKLVSPLSPVVRLAAGNVIRNPRRTTATATALLLAVTIIITLQVGVTSGREFVIEELSKRVGSDPMLIQAINQAFDALLIGATALTAVAVLIALVGVANTLILSVIERTRENALLRALGLQTGQLKKMMLIEALLIAVVGAVVGILAGLFFAWLGVTAIANMLAFDLGHGIDIPLRTDWLYTVGLIAACALAAALASIIPGRRAAKASPVEALAVV
ncbi:MAG: FtsX-like permease family protein [Propionibacteriaceae bacterium]|nr:FtsX-like permease family protein [Propionibacteriaceae bacterium]